MGEGVEDLARMELERGECLSVVCNKEIRDGLSQCIGLIMVLQCRPEHANTCPIVARSLSVLPAVINPLVSGVWWSASHNCLSTGTGAMSTNE